MNNNWYNERLVEVKRQDLDRELDQYRLLKEAGLVGENRLVRFGRKVDGGISALVKWVKSRMTLGQASYKPARKKPV